MKSVSFHRDNRDRFGVIDGEDVLDVTDVFANRALDLRDILDAGILDEVAKASGQVSAGLSLDEIDYALPVPLPRKIFCAGRNYRAYHEVMEDGTPDYPSVFARFPNSFVPHKGVILKPTVSEQLDFENELTAIIGVGGRHIEEANALNHVAGYTIANEGSVRDWQSKGSQNLPGKNFYHSGSMGPWMVTADEVGDIGNIRIITRRNGKVLQDGTTDMMITSLPFLISHISNFTELEPGDYILTGSPGGSIIESEEPKPWLKSGDRLEFEIERVGILENSVANE